MEIVKLTWKDATSPCPSITTIEFLKEVKPVDVETVGYLLVDNEEQVSIMSSKSEEDHGCDLLVVPRGMVVKLEKLGVCECEKFKDSRGKTHHQTTTIHPAESCTHIGCQADKAVVTEVKHKAKQFVWKIDIPVPFVKAPIQSEVTPTHKQLPSWGSSRGHKDWSGC